ncbi:hypothetical protein AB1Y20_014922 [Prymnesium parvum]|uniref:Uncharacterized protein n=1 Tax=Prymnesium parvum TaxID=97485 RepID=A0AB34JZ63_PRYPA
MAQIGALHPHLPHHVPSLPDSLRHAPLGSLCVASFAMRERRFQRTTTTAARSNANPSAAPTCANEPSTSRLESLPRSRAAFAM